MKYYIAKQGDSWELISFRCYGASKYIDLLMWANFEHRHVEYFGGGERLAIPEVPAAAQKAANLPPWRA